MTNLNLFPIFMIGLLGSVHCVGMCGGIVAAISSVSIPAGRFSVPVVTNAASSSAGNRLTTLTHIFSYNFGRIGSYAVAGAIAGGAAHSAGLLTGLSAIQMGGYWLANLMLVAVGLYLTGWLPALSYLELAGYGVWRRIRPLTKKILPLDRPLKLLAAGMLWGWLPCGMVYSMLFTALLSGSALSGASVMLVFGLGTLPTLLTMGLLGAKMKTWMQRTPVRLSGGVIVIGFGLLGLLRAAHGMPMNWLNALCL
jgi:sulfite exporter TauE/SafE